MQAYHIGKGTVNKLAPFQVAANAPSPGSKSASPQSKIDAEAIIILSLYSATFCGVIDVSDMKLTLYRFSK